MQTDESLSPPSQRQPSLDTVDRQIVEALRADGRLSIRALAAQVHISRANAYARVERLEQSGVILGYEARIDPVAYGYGLSAYIHLKIAQRSWKTMRARILEIPEVQHGALVSGDSDIVLLIRTKDPATLRDLVLTRLQDMPEVLATQTTLILDELAAD